MYIYCKRRPLNEITSTPKPMPNPSAEIRKAAALAACLAIACFSGCVNTNPTAPPRDTLSWSGCDTARGAAVPENPPGLRCTVLRWPDAKLQPGLHPSSEIEELRRTEGRSIPVVALATLSSLIDGKVEKGYVIQPSTGFSDKPRFCGLKFGARNFRPSGRFTTLDLDLEYTWKDRDYLYEENAGNGIAIPVYSSLQTKTSVTLPPDTVLVAGVAGKEHLIIVEIFHPATTRIVLTSEDGRTLAINEPLKLQKDKVLLYVTIDRSAQKAEDFLRSSEGKCIKLSINGVDIGRQKVARHHLARPQGEPYQFCLPALGIGQPDPESAAEVEALSERIVKQVQATGARVDRIEYRF